MRAQLDCPLSAKRRHRALGLKWKRLPTETAYSYADDFDFLIVAAMAFERVLGAVGVVMRFDESDPHGPSTIGADRT